VDSAFANRAFLSFAAGLCLFLGAVQSNAGLAAFGLAAVVLLVAARVAARRRLARLDAHRTLTASAFEDEEVRVEIALENRGRAPLVLVEVFDSFGAALAEGKALVDPGPLRPGRRHRLVYRALCSRLWGVYSVGPLAVSVADPLGLFAARRVLPELRPFDLFPRVYSVGGLDRLGARTSFAPTDTTRARPGTSTAYMGVRDFRPGDEVRRVHWPATARQGRPMVKELEIDLSPYFTLFLDLERRNRAGTGQKSTREYVVRTAASLLATAARRGDTVQLFAEGRDAVAVPPGRGELHLAYALDQLIRVRQEGRLPLVDLVRREVASVPPGSTAALLAATLFLELGELAEVMDVLRARRVQPLLVAIDMDSFVPIDERSRPRDEVLEQADAVRALAHAHEALFAVLDADEDLPGELARPDWLESA
jgi:uncharacterized protein (DUF58 family)